MSEELQAEVQATRNIFETVSQKHKWVFPFTAKASITLCVRISHSRTNQQVVFAQLAGQNKEHFAFSWI